MQTGHTRAQRGTSLVAKSFTSVHGEEVCLLLQIEAAPEQSKTLEKECEQVVKHSLLETEGEAAARLDGTLKELNGLFKGLTVSESITDIHAIALIVDTTGVLHVSHVGRAEAYVIRGGTASQITEYTRGKPVSGFVHIASGGLEPRDIVICSTQRLLRTVTPAQLAQLAQRGGELLDELTVELDAEREQAALCILQVSGGLMSRDRSRAAATPAIEAKRSTRERRRGRAATPLAFLSGMRNLSGKLPKSIPMSGALSRGTEVMKSVTGSLLLDLRNPKRKKRAHFFLLAGVVGLVLVVWVVVRISGSTQSSQTRSELRTSLERIEEQLQTADTRRLAGDTASANLILDQAETNAKSVMDHESGLFRMEALDILDRIRAKREEINNIIRLSPTVVVNLTTQNQDIIAQGFVGIGEGEFVVYDRQNLYRVLLNSVEEPRLLDEQELIVEGVPFPRFQTIVFQMTDNSIVEMINDVPTPMKTEDPAGWIKGADIKAYLRYLYVLSPENNQIYKYERLSNRYSPPAEYNVNGDLSGGLDMVIDGNVFLLKEGGQIVKLLRGEVRPFAIRYAPDGVLATATKLFKNLEGNIYFLDPTNVRVIVVTEGGASGESNYIRQYVLEGEQVGELKDLWVDEDEAQLYVLDEKRVYRIDLVK